mmetsp:Transcript_10967/g.16148  ORF Transcript_10967/g.16148 Transcript_10967/m.16148 type:complete len:225 (+) Transcript_10967:137-811(+)
MFSMMMIMMPVVLLLVAVALSNAEMVKLTDKTFEHQTQASTGGTTGSWLILFHVPNCRSCDKLKPVLEDLSEEDEVNENGVVMGSVDCSQYASVCHRFFDPKADKLPMLLYLHRGKLYRYPRDEEFGTFDDSQLKSFVLTQYAQRAEAEDIPEPPSALGVLWKQIQLTAENSTMVRYALMAMVGIIGFTVFMLLITLILSIFKKNGANADSNQSEKEKEPKKTK